MDYLHRFITAFVFTETVEIIVLFLLIWFFYSKKELGVVKIVIVGFLATFSTLPYVWFVFPSMIIISFNLYIAVSELFAFVMEAILYRLCFGFKWRMVFILSFTCNVVSFLLGLFLQSKGLWIYW